MEGAYQIFHPGMITEQGYTSNEFSRGSFFHAVRPADITKWEISTYQSDEQEGFLWKCNIFFIA